MSHITLAIVNDTDPGADPSAGDTFRAITPAVPKGNNDYFARAYPVSDPTSDWSQQVPCDKDGVGTFVLGSNVAPGTLVYVWLLRGSDFRRPFLGATSFRAG